MLTDWLCRIWLRFPHISVAGACLTATHGSGVKNGNLSTPVSGMSIVTADGGLRTVSRDSEGALFDGLVVNLGALGIVISLTLDLVPRFSIRQDVYEGLPFAELEAHFDDIMSNGYSVSMFIDWQSPNVNQIWFKRVVTDGPSEDLPPNIYGATPADGNRHPIPGASSVNCTDQMGSPGPWFNRLPHFRMDFTPSSGEELQSEYFVPRSQAFEALNEVYKMRHLVAPLLHVSEIRTIAADSFWLSPCYRQDSVAIHFTWKKNWPEVSKLLPLLESKLERFEARPHWAKLFTMSPQRLQSLYDRLPEFRVLAESYDPDGKFRNEFLDSYIC